MPYRDVRTNLRRAYEEIEDVCDTASHEATSLSNEEWLRGIAIQLRYLADGEWTDPEAAAFPDPDALDTIGERLTEVISDAEGDTAIRLQRARNEILLAISVLEDDLEKQRGTRSEVR